MYKRTIAPLLWLWLACAIIAAAVMFAVPAKADPADDYAVQYGSVICNTFDGYPNESGIFMNATDIIEDGFTLDKAGDIIVASVYIYCYEYQSLLREFGEKYYIGS